MSALDRVRRELTGLVAARLPAWMRTIRMRLTLTYSAVLFGISALALTAVYVALSGTVSAEPLNPVTVKKFYTAADGTIVYKPGEQFQVADLASVQRAVNYASLQTLQQASIVAIAVMFVLSLAIGWWVAGRALRPIGAITRATQEITATDLTRRIDASGPHDELRTLADTVDGMLDDSTGRSAPSGCSSRTCPTNCGTRSRSCSRTWRRCSPRTTCPPPNGAPRPTSCCSPRAG